MSEQPNTDPDPSAESPSPDGFADFSTGSPPAVGKTAAFVPSPSSKPKDTPRKSVPTSVSVPGYEIESVLGHGGMGVVYKAFHLTLKRTVALKMVLAGGHAGPSEQSRFRIEAEAVARLQHPNIVQIHDIGEAGGHPYFALEFVEGGNLARKIHGKPMPAREAAKLVESLARAMQLAHSRNVVHRDLKPANILLTADGTPKITDFGLARQMDSDSGETQAGTVMGTPSYMAPEQASGRAHEAGPAADVYALGAILYDCLAGQPPFKGKTVVETLDLVRTQEPAPPSRKYASVPLDLETICLKCLRKEPENRYASAAELADELVRFQRGEPILARPVGLPERMCKWTKRNPGWAAVSATVIFFLVVALVAVNEVRNQREADRIAAEVRRAADLRESRAESLIEALTITETKSIERLLDDLKEYRDLVSPKLRELARQPINTSTGLHSRLALLTDEPNRTAELAAYLPVCRPEELLIIRQLLTPHAAIVAPPLWMELSDKNAEVGQRLRAGAALAKFDPGSEQWNTTAALVVDDLVQENPIFLGIWSEAFRPVKNRLIPRLSEIFRDHQPARAPECRLATNILADYAADDPRVLGDLLMEADEKQFAVIFPYFKSHGEQGLPVLIGELDKKLPPDLPSSDTKRELLAKRQATAAVALLRLNQPAKIWPLLQHSPDPRVRSYLIHRLGPLGADAQSVVQRLGEEKDIAIRRALILSLAEFGEKDLTPNDRQTLLPRLQEMYRTESDPGLHAASEWLLRAWKQDVWLTQVNDEWAKDQAQRERASRAASAPGVSPQWYVNTQGQTLIVIPGPSEFLMGSPPTETGRLENEVQHRRRISRTFAVASKAVTMEQYRQFEPAYQIQAKYHRTPDLPAVSTTWYQSAAYCNWLSGKDGIPQDQHCYETDALGQVTKLKEKYLSLTGYRLPTEAEMEYVTRAGALTSRCYGETDDLLAKYAWHMHNAQDQTWPVGTLKPNDLGFFDVHGNCYMLCQQNFEEYPHANAGAAIPDHEGGLEPNVLVLRGGSFLSQPSFVRSTYRNKGLPSTNYTGNGFRVARTVLP